MHKRATLAIAALLALLAGGCARAAPGPAVAGPAPARSGPAAPVVHDRWDACDRTTSEFDAQDALTLPRLGDGFAPVAAVVCRIDIRERPGGGNEMIAVEARAGDLTAVLAALRLPDEPATDQACTMDLPAVPWLALLDRDGRWIRPGVPIDACGKPRVEFRTAYEKLAATTVRSRVVKQLESDEAARSGCSQTWADMAWAMTGVETVQETTLAPLPVDTAVRRCVYDVPAGERGTAKPAGDFRAGGPVPASGWTAIRAEIEASAPGVATCGTPATRFAVLHLQPGGTLYIEADGCRRILAEPANGSGVYLRSSARLTALVFP